jgi:hypothetical protein
MMRRWIALLAVAALLLFLPADVSSADLPPHSVLTTYEGFEYGYTTHFNDPNYDYESDTYWSAIVSFSGNAAGVLMIQSSLEGYPLFRIEENAFSGCPASSVIIPERVRDICAGAFSGCASLTDAYFMGERPNIADGAFPAGTTFHCLELHSASWGISASVIPIEESGDLRYLTIGGEAYVCGRSPSAGNLTIPSDIAGTPVRCVMPWAFYSDAGITAVSVSCTSIEERAFMYCSNLTALTLSDSVRNIDSEAFRKCSSLASLDLRSIRFIGFETFRDCSSLPSITVPDSVTELGEGSFYICSSAVSVSVGSGVVELLPRTFGYCSQLTDIEFGSVTSIGDSCFINDTALEDVHMPDTVTSIGDSAFSGCRSLYVVHMPSSLSHIGDSAFSGCRSLPSVTLPDTLRSLGRMAFQGCSSMKDAYFRGDMPEMGDDVFRGTAKDFRVRYDSSHADSWSGYSQTPSEEVGGDSGNNMMIIAAIAAAAVVAVAVAVLILRRRASR